MDVIHWLTKRLHRKSSFSFFAVYFNSCQSWILHPGRFHLFLLSLNHRSLLAGRSSKVIGLCVDKQWEASLNRFCYISFHNLFPESLSPLWPHWGAVLPPSTENEGGEKVMNAEKWLPNSPFMDMMPSQAICQPNDCDRDGIRGWILPLSVSVLSGWSCKVGPMKSKLVIRSLD